MTIELIDMDTGDTMEVHGDKVSGLQYSGVPSERALEAKSLLDGLWVNWEFISSSYNSRVIIEEALELMAKEKTNG